MNDDPLELLSRPELIEDEEFTRAVLRRARVRSRPGPSRLIYGAAAAAVGVVACALIGPTGPALAAIAAITWAVGAIGEP